MIEFDLKEIQKGYDTVTPVLITNTDEFAAVEPLRTTGTITAMEEFIQVKK